MGFPTLVNYSGQAGGGGTASAIGIPGSRVNGNLLVAFISIPVTGKTFSISGGWTIALSSSAGNISSAIAWRYVDGSETQPPFTWSGSASWTGETFQFSGVQAVTPIGNTNNANAGSSTSITAASITSTQDQSYILYFLLDNNTSTITSTFAENLYPYATLDFNNGSGYNCSAVCGGNLNISGTSSTALSVTVSSTDWHSYGLELLGSGTGSADKAIVTQDFIDVVATYSDPILNALSGQIIQENMETYSVPIMSAKASQIIIMVLRSAATGPSGPPPPPHSADSPCYCLPPFYEQLTTVP